MSYSLCKGNDDRKCVTKQNIMIEELKKHLQSVGKTDESWLDLAKRFNILPNGTNKQRSDKVRKIYNSIPEKKSGLYNPANGSYIPNPSNYYYAVDPYLDKASQGEMFIWNTDDTIEHAKHNKDWEEFRKWKESKNVKPIKKTNGIHLILPDVHIPYHNKELLVKLASFIQDNKHQIVGFHIIGDYLDLKSLSSHDDKTIDKSGWTLGREYEAGNLILDMFDSTLPKNIQKTYLYGNHEDRYFRYVSNIKNYKTADAIQSPTQALKLKERGYEVFEDWKEDFVQCGKYQLIHGNYCGTNPSKQHLDKLRNSLIFGHSHRVGQHFENGLHGLNIGTLADINSDGFKYLSRVERQSWCNGFAIVNVHGSYSQAELIICEDNGFFYNGKRY